ncbi:hypothetical protein [Nesterenkonia sp. DZ6]|uniref:hypothetical protein n=1 Tax=Nesterenkonia sp. DZ6 TaxID=2901229 RepID=UPI001F4C706A|nr:hypothetical protein [Nesterenkonia sp. DZ6]MCH8560163.1 hypothetical protein [Nesterenkonia sp. DZ6]
MTLTEADVGLDPGAPSRSRTVIPLVSGTEQNLRDSLRPLSPEVSSSTRCVDLIEIPVPSLHPEDSFDVDVSTLQVHGVRPLLVRDEGELIGVLEPTTVFPWCAQHRPAVLEELAALASRGDMPDWNLGLSGEP